MVNHNVLISNAKVFNIKTSYTTFKFLFVFNLSTFAGLLPIRSKRGSQFAIQVLMD